jgi:hypothetical protein
MKLTKAEVYQRLEAALAILGEEDSEDVQADLRIKNVRIFLKRASEAPAGKFDSVANDVTVN